MVRSSAVSNDGGGRIRLATIVDQPPSDLCKVTDAHQKNQRVNGGRQLIPSNVGALVVCLVTGDHRKTRRNAAMRDGNAGASGDGDCRRNSRNNLERDIFFDERQCLLATATEHKRIAALQTDDDLIVDGAIDQQLIDIGLRH